MGPSRAKLTQTSGFENATRAHFYLYEVLQPVPFYRERLGSGSVQEINMPLFWLLGNTMASPGARSKDVLQTCFFETKEFRPDLAIGLHANYSIELQLSAAEPPSLRESIFLATFG